MGAKAEEKRSYQIPANHFVDRLRAIDSAGLGFSLKSENPDGNGVWFRILHGMTAKSYGEKITVTLTFLPTGTDVNVHSECGMPTQLFDMGQNKKNVTDIFHYLEWGMPLAGSAAPTPSPAAQTTAQTVPQAAAAPAVRYCAYCGAPNAAGGKFCTSCGKPMI